MTDSEREHVMNGNLNELVEQQRRLDEEREAQVRHAACMGGGGGGGGWIMRFLTVGFGGHTPVRETRRVFSGITFRINFYCTCYRCLHVTEERLFLLCRIGNELLKDSFCWHWRCGGARSPCAPLCVHQQPAYCYEW